MSKNIFGKLLAAVAVAAVVVPYQYERDENGFTLASVLGKVEYRRKLTPSEEASAPDDTKGVTTISFPGLLEDQISAVKRLFTDGAEIYKQKQAELTKKIVEKKKQAQKEAEEAAETLEEKVEDVAEAVEEAVEELSEA